MIGGGEHAGSGTDKIRAGWRYQHWRAPLLTTFQEPDRVRLTLPLVSLIPEETALRLRAFFGAELDGLSPAEMQALATADLEGAVSNARLQQLLVDHPVDITRTLTSLCERGLLVSDNRRRWTTYELFGRRTRQSLFDTDAGSAGELSDLASDPRHLAGDSGHMGGDSGHMAGDSGHIGADSGHMRHDSAPVSEGTTERLCRIAASIANRRRVDPERMIATISELCTGRFLTSSQLAELLGRNPEGLRRRYLTPMVRKGLLRPRYPEATNRPDQAYTAAGGQ